MNEYQVFHAPPCTVGEGRRCSCFVGVWRANIAALEQQVASLSSQLEEARDQRDAARNEIHRMSVLSAVVQQRLEHNKAMALAALREALDHVSELEEAWQRGAIHETDGKGGTRSNRNVEVRVRLRQVIRDLEGDPPTS